MTAFSTTGGTSHLTNLTGLTDGQGYIRYVRCQDTAGNANQVSVSISLSVASPSGSIVLFSSNWSTALGTSDNAITDGGRWNWRFCGFTDVTNIINGASVGWAATPNVMEVTHAGQDCTQVSIQPVPGLASGQNYYIRMYIRMDATNQNEDPANHPISIHPVGAIQGVPWQPHTVNFPPLPAGVYKAITSGGAVSGSQSDNGWNPSPHLQTGVWYRFEWEYEFVNVRATDADYRVWPRVYDMSGTLIRDASSFTRTPGWGGDTSQTLANWYSTGGLFRFTDLSLTRDFGVGYEGPAGASNTGQHWYYAKVGIGVNDWIGP